MKNLQFAENNIEDTKAWLTKCFPARIEVKGSGNLQQLSITRLLDKKLITGIVGNTLGQVAVSSNFYFDIILRVLQSFKVRDEN
jgi:hypothetical protein